MKFRNILGKDKLLRPYLELKTGVIHYGNYYVNNILKIGVVTQNKNEITIRLLPNYNSGNTISLKPNKNIIGYKVIFYGELTRKQNYDLIKQNYRNMKKTQILNFWTVHYKELENVFGKYHFKKLLIKTCLELNLLPLEIEILYKGKVVTDITYLREKCDNIDNFGLLTNIKNSICCDE